MATGVAGSLLFWWYWADSKLRPYPRSPRLNTAVVAVGLVAVPCYVLRSRKKGERLAACARLLGFVVLMVGAWCWDPRRSAHGPAGYEGRPAVGCMTGR